MTSKNFIVIYDPLLSTAKAFPDGFLEQEVKRDIENFKLQDKTVEITVGQMFYVDIVRVLAKQGYINYNDVIIDDRSTGESWCTKITANGKYKMYSPYVRDFLSEYLEQLI